MYDNNISSLKFAKGFISNEELPILLLNFSATMIVFVPLSP